MSRPRQNRSLVYALYANAALLLAILVVLASRGSSNLMPAAYGQQAAPPSIAGGNGIYVMPAQFLRDNWGCYVLDTEKQSINAYGWYGTSNKPELRLIAARSIVWDRQLTNWSTSPSPDEIKNMVQLGQQPIRGMRQPANAVPRNEPELPAKSE